MRVPDTFYRTMLEAIGAPVTATTLAFCHAWQACEGGDARWNPFNTTQPANGATDYNSVGVKNYPDEATGVHATVVTLHNGRYPAIIDAFRTQDVERFGSAVDDSPWGTHGVAHYLQENPPAAPGHGGTNGGDDIVASLPTIGHGAGMPPKNANQHVKNAQALLGAHGHVVHPDGRFGDDTDRATRAFQTEQGIASDGVIGPDTWGKLLNV